jgi:hypothetical protein
MATATRVGRLPLRSNLFASWMHGAVVVVSAFILPSVFRSVFELFVPPDVDAPDNWAVAITHMVWLFIVSGGIGTTYGGDGVNTFALPDLRGRTIIHSMGTTYELGDVLGEEQHALLASEMPTHTHSVVPEPAPGILCLIAALTLPARRTRRRSGNDGHQPR